MLEVIDLHFDYPEQRLLEDIAFKVAPGTLLHIKGGNGVGKTTLLKLLSGLLSPHAGEIRYQDKPIDQNLAIYQAQVCYVGHKLGVSQLLTAREHCEFELHAHQRDYTISALLASVGLTEHADLPVGLLSAGQARKVALLRLFMTKARIWLLDEPFIALDQSNQRQLSLHIESHLIAGGYVILTSHQPVPIEANYAEYTW